MRGSAASLTPDRFVEKWSRAELGERQASQEHFLDLCHILEVPSPATADAAGLDYCFEKPVTVVGAASKGSKGTRGFVDVWKRGCFGWEYKAKGKYKSLDEAYRQLYQYRDALDNPLLSVVCDIRSIEIRTHFPKYPTAREVIRLEEVPAKAGRLRWLFQRPENFRPQQDTEETTAALAATFAELADRLLSRHAAVPASLFQGVGDPVAHFLMKVMFCLFAEDVGLLPERVFTRLVERCLYEPEAFQPACAELFEKMRRGGYYGNDRVHHFNGGLYDDTPPLALTLSEIPLLAQAAAKGWAGVEPSIFGTLFERVLDPGKRAQIGAHYTGRADILLVVEPVVMTPLRRRWDELGAELGPALTAHDHEPDRRRRETLAAPIREAVEGFRLLLGRQQVLDPACGSGNFLYVALQQLLDPEDEAVRFCARRDIVLDPIPRVRPAQLHGIEINPYAAELAQVVVWIGYLQWLHVHGVEDPRRPILDRLQTIENRDAILDRSDRADPRPAAWPRADFIVGNPPFLGAKLFRQQGLSDDYLEALWHAYDLPRNSDLCCYWFERGRRALTDHPDAWFGLLATQGIRGGENRQVLQRIKRQGDIFMAWPDRNWILDGAAVHVSIVAFDRGAETRRTLDGQVVAEIHPNLRAGLDMTQALTLGENAAIAFMGDTKGGAFDVDHDEARRLLGTPNPNGRPTSDVVRAWVNGLDLTRRPRSMYLVDFGCGMSVADAAGYEAAFKLAEERVRPQRTANRRRAYADRWWLHVEPRPDMRRRLAPHHRFLATPRVTKHRLFAWVSGPVLPDCQVIAFARSDDYFYGVLHSAPHELWARAMGTQLREEESGFRYTPSTTFEMFPLPFTPGRKDVRHHAYQAVATAAARLEEQRERWLNPPEWVRPIEDRVDAGDDFADVPADARPLVRRSAVMAEAAGDPKLRKRTLTNLYNERPTWLRMAHERLDRAVLAAYAATDPEGNWDEGWAAVWADVGPALPLPPDHPMAAERARVDRAVLANLLRLNQARA